MSLAFRVSGEDKAVEHITSGMFCRTISLAFKVFSEVKAVGHITSGIFVE